MNKQALRPRAKRFRDCERRLVLLEWLRSRHDHPSAAACLTEMQRLIPGIGQSTVYRHLSSLVKSGLAKELRPDKGPARFDATLNAHAHFLCLVCGAVLDAIDVSVTGKWPGKTEEVVIVANGTCGECT